MGAPKFYDTGAREKLEPRSIFGPVPKFSLQAILLIDFLPDCML